MIVRPVAGLDDVASKNTSWLTPGFSGDTVNAALGGVPAPTGTTFVTNAVAPLASVTVRVTLKLLIVRNWWVVD